MTQTFTTAELSATDCMMFFLPTHQQKKTKAALYIYTVVHTILLTTLQTCSSIVTMYLRKYVVVASIVVITLKGNGESRFLSLVYMLGLICYDPLNYSQKSFSFFF